MTLAIIGGTGLADLNFKITQTHQVSSAYAQHPIAIAEYQVEGKPLLMLSRHTNHITKKPTVPPHLINYRAIIDSLSQIGCSEILAFNAVGGFYINYPPGSWIVPKQVIDYTWGREHTFSDENNLIHIDFTEPFDEKMRENLVKILLNLEETVYDRGVYACVQGPRLETAAEIEKLDKDGCCLVGMTLMPEASLAREKNIPYTSLCYVTNMAAGINLTLRDLPDLNFYPHLMKESAEKIIPLVVSSQK